MKTIKKIMGFCLAIVLVLFLFFGTSVTVEKIEKFFHNLQYLIMGIAVIAGLYRLKKSFTLRAHAPFREGLDHAAPEVREETVRKIHDYFQHSTDVYGDLTFLLLNALEDSAASVRLAAAEFFAAYIDIVRSAPGSRNPVFPYKMYPDIVLALNRSLKDDHAPVRRMAAVALEKLEKQKTHDNNLMKALDAAQAPNIQIIDKAHPQDDRISALDFRPHISDDISYEKNNPLKQFCFVVSLGYVALAVLVQLKVLDGIFFHALWFLPSLSFSEAACGFLLVGFIALFVGTIFIKIKNNETEKSADASVGKITRLISFLVVINITVNFFAFAAISSGDHGIPQILSDGRYVMAYRTEIIRVIDAATYERELNIYQSRTRLLFAAVMLLFTWGIFTIHMPKTQKSTQKRN
ncbi:hypothetical protein DENIS_2043 [Desulfonema ishimotonii]|uniref:HEAT repeat domain-containing protein n=1 Tax=Desulfonema ishimotonii TaxID=45657 RepID=A0A401FVV4_9BACT|nr:hypothetical protein [Desulfonema ishimotonii]GBC61083.1 hypothetical protein DENIS_2043 [Desulfonema ishimotonii]